VCLLFPAVGSNRTVVLQPDGRQNFALNLRRLIMTLSERLPLVREAKAAGQ
jgi:hypothetical protein